MKIRAIPHAAHPHSMNSLTHLSGGLRRTVAARLMRDFGVRIPPPLIRRVLDDATDLAHETGFPSLFFPAIAEEKARLVFAALGRSPANQARQNLQYAA